MVVLFVGTWGLLRDSVNLALDGVPEGIDAVAVAAYLATLPGVTEVHDLHIWAMSTTETARASADLHERFGIAHPTIQIERGDPAHPCDSAAPEAILSTRRSPPMPGGPGRARGRPRGYATGARAVYTRPDSIYGDV